MRGETEKAKKESMKARKALVQAQADAEEQQKAATTQKRVAEDVLDGPVTKKVKPLPCFFQVSPTFVTDPDFRRKSARPLFSPTRMMYATYLLHPLRRH